MAEYTFPIPNYKGNPANTWHTQGGTDLFAPRGTPILSISSGVVTGAGYDSLGGNYVLIRGDDGRDYYYAHMQNNPFVGMGQRVTSGLPIGEVGDSGNAVGTGTHLHLGIGYGIQGGGGPTGGVGINFDAQTFLKNLLHSAGDVAQNIRDTAGNIIGQAGGTVTQTAQQVNAQIQAAIAAAGGQFAGQQNPVSQWWENIVSFLKNLMANFVIDRILDAAPLVFIGVGTLFMVLGLTGLALQTGETVMRIPGAQAAIGGAVAGKVIRRKMPTNWQWV